VSHRKIYFSHLVVSFAVGTCLFSMGRQFWDKLYIYKQIRQYFFPVPFCNIKRIELLNIFYKLIFSCGNNYNFHNLSKASQPFLKKVNFLKYFCLVADSGIVMSCHVRRHSNIAQLALNLYIKRFSRNSSNEFINGVRI
jgi:hypothetical protein